MIRQAYAPLTRLLAASVVAAAMSVSFAWQPAAAATGADLGLQLPGDPAVGTMIAAEQALLNLTNADRVANGLDALEFDQDALAIARQRAATQIDQPTLSHYNAAGDL